MDTDAYVAFLLFGVLLIVVDGQIIYRSGRRYFENLDSNANAGASMVMMVTVLFHLALLGVLALISVLNFGGGSTQGVVVRLGVLLLIIAVAHALTIGLLARVRGDQVEEEITASRLPNATSDDPVLEERKTVRRTRSAFEHESAYTPPEG